MPVPVFPGASTRRKRRERAARGERRDRRDVGGEGERLGADRDGLRLAAAVTEPERRREREDDHRAESRRRPEAPAGVSGVLHQPATQSA
jgi:hypothetical protein